MTFREWKYQVRKAYDRSRGRHLPPMSQVITDAGLRELFNNGWDVASAAAQIVLYATRQSE